MPSAGRNNVLLTKKEWEFIFKALELSRSTFSRNPVLVDSMPNGARVSFIDQLTEIMLKIGMNGEIAHVKGVSSKESHHAGFGEAVEEAKQD